MLYHVFIEPDIMKSEYKFQNILNFCCSICTEITFETHLDNYSLSDSEYKKALNDFINYYQNEDRKRRNEFTSNHNFRRILLNTYQTPKGVSDYFDRLHQYDFIQLDELKNDLKQYLIASAKDKTSSMSNNEISMYAKQSLTLPKEAYQGSMYTFHSHCTVGGLYKVYRFHLLPSVINLIMAENDIFQYYVFEDAGKLEDPAFYSDNNLILSVCSHEHTSVFHLSEEQYKAFQRLSIPYSLSSIIPDIPYCADRQ